MIRRALRAGHRPRSLPDGGALAHRPGRPGRGRRAVGRAGLRRRRAGDRGDDRLPPAPRARWRRCTAPSCPRRRRCSPAPAGSRSSRTSSTTPTSARSSATAPRSGSTRCWSPRAAPTRSTGAASGSRWARCSRCRGPASTPGPAASRCCGTTGSAVAAFALADDAVSLDDLAAEPPERLAVVFGAEGDGLSRRTIGGRRPRRADPDGRGSGLAERGCGERSGPVGPAPAAAVRPTSSSCCTGRSRP